MTVDPRHKWFVIGLVGVGTFMSALDGSVVNIALPLIQRHYGAGIGGVEWVVTAYLLVISSLLLTFGRLGDMWGFKLPYATGYLVFGLGSLLCALAPSLGWLILARSLQGVGASLLMAISPALTVTSFPGSERGRALGLQSTLTYVGIATGPALGGWIAGHLGWQWVFLVNIPVAALGFTAALVILHPTPGRARQHFDPAGAGLFAGGLLALLVALSQAEVWGWGSPASLGLLVGGALLLVLFVWQERRAAQPIVPLWLFRNPALGGGLLAAFLQYAVVNMVMFLLPFYLLAGRGFSPEIAGAILTAQPVAMVAVTAFSGWLSDRLGTRWPSTAGIALLAISVWILSVAGGDASVAGLIARLGLAGLGVGLFTSPNNSSIMGAAPSDRQGVAAGLLATGRNVGLVTGVAVGGSLYALLQARLLAAGMAAAPASYQALRGTLWLGVALAAAGTVLCLLRPGPAAEPVPAP